MGGRRLSRLPRRSLCATVSLLILHFRTSASTVSRTCSVLSVSSRLFARWSRRRLPAAQIAGRSPAQPARAADSLDWTRAGGRRALHSCCAVPKCGCSTLTGPGGTGKTRLSLQLAAELLDDFADGVWFVDLAPLSDPVLVLSTIAQTLGVREIAGQPIAGTLAAYLRAKQILLVLDNFEQVLAAAAALTTLLRAAAGSRCSSPAVRCCASRVSMITRCLRWPSPTSSSPAAGATEAICGRGVVHPASSSSEARLRGHECERTGGGRDLCPAGWAAPGHRACRGADQAVAAPALLARLDNRLQLLTGGARDQPARQQTLRAAIDWSYQLLSASEQVLFAAAGVFMGGCTLEAAEAVCQDEESEWDVLEGVQSLLEKSLLRHIGAEAREPRFTMLETIREYSVERLEISAEADGIYRRHAGYYLALAEAGAPEVFKTIEGTPERSWLDRVAAEHDNLRSALQWVIHHDDVELALRFGAALWHFWASRGYSNEGRRWLTAILALPAQVPLPALRARTCFAAAGLAENQNDWQLVQALYQESLALFRATGDARGSAWALFEWTNTVTFVEWGDTTHPSAQRHTVDERYAECLALFRAAGDIEGTFGVLSQLLVEARKWGDHSRYKPLLAEAEALLNQVVDKRRRASMLAGLGNLIAEGGDYARARPFYEESLALHRELGDRRRLASALTSIGELARDNDDLEWAATILEESVALLRDLGDPEQPGRPGSYTAYFGRNGAAAVQRRTGAGAGIRVSCALAGVREHFRLRVGSQQPGLYGAACR